MLSENLNSIFQQHWQAILASDASVKTLESDAKLFSAIQKILMGSDFVARTWCRYPEIVKKIITETLWQPLPVKHFEKILTPLINAESEIIFMQQLRQQRHFSMVHIIGRMLLDLADLEETLADLTQLADAAIDLCVHYYSQVYAQEWGLAYNEKKEPMNLVVLGLGKLGASELNLSSDVDLIFAFESEGITQGGRLSLDHTSYFIRIGQKIIHALNTVTDEGFVFRVDMRLRPYGQSGALVMSFDAMELYYEEQGREWERYAFIKARVVAGDKKSGAQLLALLKPFVYRRYIDFGVYAALRDMKKMIEQEVARKGIESDIKVGAGGIREIEFFAQVFQLLRGGREVQLQTNHLLTTLAVLEKLNWIHADVYHQLKTAYIFLRHLEHRLQAINDEQTQKLPTDTLIQARVAHAMNFLDWSHLMIELDAHRQKVSAQFQQIIQPVVDEATPNAFDIQDENLKAFYNARLIQQLHGIGRERLDQFMPRLLAKIKDHPKKEDVLPPLLHLIEAIVRRSAYLALLNENPRALDLLITLCAASPWIADQLTQKPILLDDILSRPPLQKPPTLESLMAQLHKELMPVKDLETFMETLRHFKNAQVMQVIVAEIQQTLPLMKVSDALTWIAEALLSAAFNWVWKETVMRWGGDPDAKPDLIIVAYGKLGGLELGPDSDLDLVFIHPKQLNIPLEKTVETEVFYTRLVQRLIHVLTAQTHLGALYEVDLRLRPSGASGLLVTNMDAFEQYQTQQAWTWEHQALVRARVVAGSAQLTQSFEQVRRRVLSQIRDTDLLRQQVLDMRQKMRQHFTPAPQGQFDLKYGVGGMVDLEFLVQFSVLHWAHQYPALMTYTDNIRILDALADAQLLPQKTAENLQQVYIAYRAAGHGLVLQNQSLQVSDHLFQTERKAVIELWQQWLG